MLYVMDRWRSERLRTALAAIVLFVLNAWITLRLFRTPYTRQMGSIEAAFIALARYIRDHFPHLGWFPLWYGGIPFPDAYPPLLHVLVAAVSGGTRISPGLAYHLVTATLYALGPVTLLWAALRLGAGRVPAFAAALGYSLISPTCWLVRDVRVDAGGFLGPRRLQALAGYGEGPHIAALLFLPLAIALLQVAVEKRCPHWYVLAALAMAATVLSNWIGAFALAMAVLAWLLSGIHKGGLATWMRTAAIGLGAYAIALPWVTPSTVATINANAPRLVGFAATGAHRWLVLTAALVAVLIAWALRTWNAPAAVRFGVLFLYGPAVIALSAFWFGFDFLPQSKRYHLEMDLAFWMAAAMAASCLPAMSLSGRRWVAVLLLAACVPIAIHQRRVARDMERPIAIESTAEYRISRWLAEHLPGRRVFAPGTIAFWMDAFSDTPMLDGGFDNGIRNTLLWDVNYQIYAGDRLGAAVAWLKAFGCSAVVGGDRASTEVYHPYNHPEKFHSLPEIWREGPEVIYAVPHRSDSLAHVVMPGDLVASVPVVYDPVALTPYLAALDNPALPAADFRWRGGDMSAGAATITGDLRPEQLLSVQIAWDKGWMAMVNGRRVPMWGDRLGQIAIQPRCDGQCTVDLIYDGGLEARLARWISLIALAAGALWILWDRLHARVAR